ncbi:protein DETOXIFICATION 33-like [Oryza glaberrima]|uniref:protein DETOXIFICATION 33-like n=1 Tax=Oryza glaberrima TaxID=4538 RepID=UPI00224C3A68|nr:protein DETOXIFICATION 33-like [Oryza glaberrima]
MCTASSCAHTHTHKRTEGGARTGLRSEMAPPAGTEAAGAGHRKNWRGESGNLWRIAGPVILTEIFQFLIGFVTAAFVGHIGKVELAAVSVVNGVVEGLAFGLLLGMGSALETLCGQAVGAGQPRMLGVYLQRSWVICLATSLALLPLYLLASPALRLLRQSAAISSVAGRYARWCAPQLFAYAVNFPMQKFYQAQSRVWAVTAISAAALAAHALLNWLVVARLGHGVVGAALVGDVSWWLLNAAQFAYLVGGSFPEAWSGFSRKAFTSLGGFVKLSLSSAVMLCLEMWYYTAVLILVGCLKNPEIQVGAISICMNYQLWTLMVAVGFNAAVSVRVANELGANHPKAAKFSVIVAVVTSAAVGLVFTLVALVARKQLPRLFTDDDVLVRETAKLGYLLAATIFLNSIQPVLSGVAIGAGWQSSVAFVNIGCYYLVGLPIAAVFGFRLSLNATGIWVGMLIGTILQTVILLVILYRTKWQKEAMLAEERIKVWGGGVELPTIQEAS